MEGEFCKVRREDAVLIVSMDRPEKLNALSDSAHREMIRIWDDFFNDPALRVAILTGEGRAFCAGGDITAYSAGKNSPVPPEGVGGLTGRATLPKPIIAAVNGPATGGGMEMVLACDLVIASEKAFFSLPEPLVGSAALGGGISRLCRKLPFNIALGLLLTGDRLPAQEAHRIGLVNEVVPHEELLDAARRWAAKIVRGAPISIRTTREIAALAAEGASLSSALETELANHPRIADSADFVEGMKAFLDRREPVWADR